MRQRGFTLLEVLVAVAILGLGLTAILSAQAGTFASSARARNISVATGLLRCKMSELEEHLYREGFQDTDETGAGPCCETDEVPGMRCSWHIDRPQFPEAQFGQLDLGAGLNFGGSGGPGGAGGPGALGALGLLSGAGGPSPLGSASGVSDVAKMLADANAQALSPAGTSTSPAFPVPAPSGSTGAPPGAPNASGAGGAMGGLASMAMSFVYPSLKLLFEASTRRITATLTFREGQKESSIDVVEWFSVPQLGLQSADDASQDANNPASSSASTTSGKTGGTSSGGTPGGSSGFGPRGMH